MTKKIITIMEIENGHVVNIDGKFTACLDFATLAQVLWTTLGPSRPGDEADLCIERDGQCVTADMIPSREEMLS